MLTKDLILSLRKSLQFFTKLKILPFRSNKANKYLEVTKDLKNNFCVAMFALLDVIFLTPVFIVQPRAFFESDLGIGETIIVVDGIIIALMSILMRIGFYLYRYQISVFLNAYLHYEASICKSVHVFYCKSTLKKHFNVINALF